MQTLKKIQEQIILTKLSNKFVNLLENEVNYLNFKLTNYKKDKFFKKLFELIYNYKKLKLANLTVGYSNLENLNFKNNNETLLYILTNGECVINYNNNCIIIINTIIKKFHLHIINNIEYTYQNSDDLINKLKINFFTEL